MFPNPSCLWFSFVLASWIINEFENIIYKKSVARPLTASAVNQPLWRADLVVRAGSYLLFGGNKFSSTGAQNYAMSSQTQVNTKLIFFIVNSFSTWDTYCTCVIKPHRSPPGTIHCERPLGEGEELHVYTKGSIEGFHSGHVGGQKQRNSFAWK